MRRRDFVATLGSAVFWPHGTLGQQTRPLRRIGTFIVGHATAAAATERALREGLENRGWVEGQTMRLEQRRIRGGYDFLREDALSLVASAPEVIVAGGTDVNAVIKEATQIIPVVFVHVADPVAGGLVQSLAKPGGNFTGFSAYESSIGGKWVELIREIIPSIKQVLVIAGQTRTWRMHVPPMQAAATKLGIELAITHVKSVADVQTAIESFSAKPDRGMIVLPDIVLEYHRKEIIALAAQHRMPDLYGTGGQSGWDGLVYYSSDWVDLYRRAASYVDRILRGAKPGELPVQEPTKFRLIVNLKTAKALGLVVPTALLARADEVIE